MSTPVLHAPNWNGDDRALCGLSSDAHQDAKALGEQLDAYVEAKPGESVTCPECRRAIDHVCALFWRSRGYQMQNR